MRRLDVQIQPEKSTHDAEQLVTLLRDTADGTTLRLVGEHRDEDRGPYINVSFTAEDHVAGWERLRARYDASDPGRALSASTIVTCEGSHGWDDYLLLHHFDRSVETDEVH